MTPEEIKKVLENHKHWIKEDCKGWENMRANLCGANLREANLYRADLYGANLCGANLREADLCGADLCGANLCGANLREANLYRADLCRADLLEADLREADLCGANLCGANLREANLYRANLCGANLCGADLLEANLRGANLREANLYRADLCRAKNIPFIPIACPDSGLFIGWKKCNIYIVKLLIPEDALRSSATTRKCRCSKAKVLEIQTLDGKPATTTYAISNHDPSFIYAVGETVSVNNFDTDRWHDCAPGIHFFINRQEAVDY